MKIQEKHLRITKQRSFKNFVKPLKDFAKILYQFNVKLPKL